jgi:drug/metabolite transporter (DMT)-like permease
VAALRGRALVAYLIVCVVWGSTYLAIRIGVGALPPFLFAGVRFLVAGGVLLGLALALGHSLPRSATEWRLHAVVGVLLLAGGNGAVVWAEQFVTSGAASLFVVTVALWMAFFDAVLPGGRSVLGCRVVIGLVIGFAGTALLVGATPAELASADLRGPLALTGASASWALGSIYYKRRHSEAHPYVASSMQMLAGGTAVSVLGLMLGEAVVWRFTAPGIGALAYLVVAGSMVGYSAYAYALRHAPATIVGTYAYVNPIVAVLLGWVVLDEPLTSRTFVAMGLILGAVLWIQLSHRWQRPTAVAADRSAPPRPVAAPHPAVTPSDAG